MIEDVFLGIDLGPSLRCHDRGPIVKIISVPTTSVESLEGSSTLPAEVEHLASHSASECPNGLFPTISI